MAKKGLSDIKVLIVDDSMFMRNIIRQILEKEGCKSILTASSGNDASEICKLSMPELVLLDLNMADGDGMSVLEKIKPFFPDVKCIVVSALNQKEIIERSLSLGALEYIQKPFHAKQLLSAIGRVLGDD